VQVLGAYHILVRVQRVGLAGGCYADGVLLDAANFEWVFTSGLLRAALYVTLQCDDIPASVDKTKRGPYMRCTWGVHLSRIRFSCHRYSVFKAGSILLCYYCWPETAIVARSVQGGDVDDRDDHDENDTRRRQYMSIWYQSYFAKKKHTKLKTDETKFKTKKIQKNRTTRLRRHIHKIIIPMQMMR